MHCREPRRPRLILPGLTGIRPELTIAAALGLLIAMLGAIVFHLGRDEAISISTNVLNALILGYLAYGRWRLAPLDLSDCAII